MLRRSAIERLACEIAMGGIGIDLGIPRIHPKRALEIADTIGLGLARSSGSMHRTRVRGARC
jgi:hypothetical protein